MGGKIPLKECNPFSFPSNSRPFLWRDSEQRFLKGHLHVALPFRNNALTCSGLSLPLLLLLSFKVTQNNKQPFLVKV